MKAARLAVASWAALALVGCSQSGGPADGGADAGDLSRRDAAGDLFDLGGADARGEGLAPRRCHPLPVAAGTSDGPVALLGAPRFGDRPPGLGIDQGSVAHLEVELLGRTLSVHTFTVTTFSDHFGHAWQSDVTVVAPAADDLAAADVAAVVAQTQTLFPVGATDVDPTWGSAHPPWFAGTDNAAHFRASYASVAADLGVPVIFGDPVPAAIVLDGAISAKIAAAVLSSPDPCDDGQSCAGTISDENVLTGCLRAAAYVEQDLSYDPYLHFAVAQMRIVDAAEQVLDAYYQGRSGPTLSWTRIFSIGNSKRGNSQRIYAAVDPRCAGVVVSAADVGNYAEFEKLQRAVWQQGGQTFLSWSDQDHFDLSPFHPIWSDAFDVARWRASVLDDVSYVVAVGTNDRSYPLPSSLLYRDALPATARVLLVPNYGHGMGSVDHVATLRALVAAGLGRPWIRVDAAWSWDEEQVVAELSTTAGVAAVELWCADQLDGAQLIDACTGETVTAADDPDLRFKRWSRTAMQPVGPNSYAAAVTPSIAYPACLVRVRAADGGVSTSGPLLSEALCQAANL